MDCDRSGKMPLHLVRRCVLHEVEESVRLGGDVGRVLAGPGVVGEMRQLGLVLSLEVLILL